MYWASQKARAELRLFLQSADILVGQLIRLGNGLQPNWGRLEVPKPSQPGAPTTPPRFPEGTPPRSTYPSGDYSYTLEVVMGMQKTLGELTQAVRTLTDEVKGHGVKIDASCADIHAAKVVVRVLLAIAVGTATFLGFIGKASLDYFSNMPPKP